ncbi:FkbM family methyltransferase [Phenylobacterium sp. RIFCSPHIGHO2_01_FULL_69_31]|uniref:FkbM family methyltransferase n=1 Tax=Phenylobacterium sp. RIFCSPHIGHO2_01_FULL_69_31 TaxID=1801944 RepID=UPI0025FDDCE4|nr:FkbM family methyltransferase [Phenylobacterium sp. RIFCSPHIGHO2_01_FULL_69_31]
MEFIETINASGLMLRIPRADTGVGQMLRETGAFAPVEQEFIQTVCDGDLLDVGANVGALCLPFALQKRSSKVVAIEAHPGLFSLLSRNAADNALDNVKSLNAVAGETSGRVNIPVTDLTSEGNHGASSLYEKGLPTSPVPMVRIDDVAPERCRFAKVDVEGFEDRVLRGATTLLHDVRPNWLVEVSRQRPNTTSLVCSTLKGAGYRLFWFFSPWRCPVAPGATGDTAIFACDGPAPWDMRPVDGIWPTTIDDYPYLSRFTA